MHRLVCLLAFWVVLAAGAVPVPAAPEPVAVTAVVTGVRSDRGRVLASLCRREGFLTRDCTAQEAVAARSGRVMLRFADVAPGRYAVQAFHDEDADGDLDRGLLGLPREGYGFSNDAAAVFGPPRFDAAAVTVADAPVEVLVPLHYPDRPPRQGGPP